MWRQTDRPLPTAPPPRIPNEHLDRDWGDAHTSQGMPNIASKLPEDVRGTKWIFPYSLVPEYKKGLGMY